MEWIDIKKEEPDRNRVHFLTNGKTVFAAGTKTTPFFLQWDGEDTTISDFIPTHWTTLPELPKKESHYDDHDDR